MKEKIVIQCNRTSEARSTLSSALMELYQLENLLDYKGSISQVIEKLKTIEFEEEE